MTRNTDPVIKALEQSLADTFTLALKTQNYHWNLVGSNFFSLHNLLEEQYNDGFAAADEIAERIRALAAPAPGERSETHTSEIQSLMRISHPVVCSKKKTDYSNNHLFTSTHILLP